MNTIFVKKSNRFTRVSPKDIKRKKFPFLVTYVDNKKILVILKREHDIHQIIVERVSNVPLYKQAIQMQMGRTPKATTSTRNTYRYIQAPYNDNEMIECYEEY